MEQRALTARFKLRLLARLNSGSTYDKRNLPLPIPRSEHNMAADSPRDVKVNLDIIARRLIKRLAVLPRQLVHLHFARAREPAHEHLPRGTAPAIGDTLEHALAELGILGCPDAPLLDVTARVAGLYLEHTAPLCDARRFLRDRRT